LFVKAHIARRLIVVLDQRVNVYALETLEKLSTLETAANPKVRHSHGTWMDSLSRIDSPLSLKQLEQWPS
jgi:hypothetical protein